MWFKICIRPCYDNIYFPVQANSIKDIGSDRAIPPLITEWKKSAKEPALKGLEEKLPKEETKQKEIERSKRDDRERDRHGRDETARHRVRTACFWWLIDPHFLIALRKWLLLRKEKIVVGMSERGLVNEDDRATTEDARKRGKLLCGSGTEIRWAESCSVDMIANAKVTVFLILVGSRSWASKIDEEPRSWEEVSSPWWETGKETEGRWVKLLSAILLACWMKSYCLYFSAKSWWAASQTSWWSLPED